MSDMTVLVIDDEPAIRLLCRVNLEADGIDVVEAQDGVSGLEQARRSHPDAILLDVMLPGDDGFVVAERLRADDTVGDVPIVFLTARADLDASEQLRRAGAAGCITKPFNPVTLAAQLREFAR